MGTNPVVILIMCCSLQKCEVIKFCCSSHLVCGAVFGQPQQTRTVITTVLWVKLVHSIMGLGTSASVTNTPNQDWQVAGAQELLTWAGSPLPAKPSPPVFFFLLFCSLPSPYSLPHLLLLKCFQDDGIHTFLELAHSLRQAEKQLRPESDAKETPQTLTTHPRDPCLISRQSQVQPVSQRWITKNLLKGSDS